MGFDGTFGGGERSFIIDILDGFLQWNSRKTGLLRNLLCSVYIPCLYLWTCLSVIGREGIWVMELCGYNSLFVGGFFIGWDLIIVGFVSTIGGKLKRGHLTLNHSG